MRSADYGGAPGARRDGAHARRGMLWITEESGARDVLLRSGQSFTFRRAFSADD